MNVPPLQRSVVNDNKQVDHVWYGFFRAIYSAIAGVVNSTGSLISAGLADKLNANTPNGAVGWEDLRAPATAINPTGIVAAPSYDDVNVGYSFNPTLDQRVDIIFQLPHAWKKGTNIRPHIHVRPLANSNGNVLWQLHTSFSNNFGVQPAFTITNTNMVISNSDGNIILKEYKITFGNTVPNVLSNESSCVKYKLIRMGADGQDTYAGDILLDEFDCHYLAEKAGTSMEYPGA